jgi:hypothetical protein
MLTQKKLSQSQPTPGDIEFSRMLEVRAKLVPLITGALGTMKKGLDQNLQLLPGHLSATELQKVTIMSTAHIIR